MIPDYLTDLVMDYEPTRTLLSSSQSLLQLPPSRQVTTAYYGKRAFSVAAITYLLPYATLHLLIVSSANSKLTFLIILVYYRFFTGLRDPHD